MTEVDGSSRSKGRGASSFFSSSRRWLVLLLLLAVVVVYYKNGISLQQNQPNLTIHTRERCEIDFPSPVRQRQQLNSSSFFDKVYCRGQLQQQQQQQHQTTTTTTTKELCQKQYPPSPEQCRNEVFGNTRGQGGKMTMNLKECNNPNVYNVCEDLKDFTGLAQSELDARLQRQYQYHFESEHSYWNPTTHTELAWYYSSSVSYLFANALHGVRMGLLQPIIAAAVAADDNNNKYEPILDYSGGVGNNIIYLASQGIKCQYFGIGIIEHAFAEYRIRKRGLQNLVEFIRPYGGGTSDAGGGVATGSSSTTSTSSNNNNWKFDPISAPLKRDQSLGAIIAMDVLEHIPNYHLVVQAMVDSIRVGGVIIEHSPFSKTVQQQAKDDGDDTRVHLTNGGISMAVAMGPRMKFVPAMNHWEKVSE